MAWAGTRGQVHIVAWSTSAPYYLESDIFSNDEWAVFAHLCPAARSCGASAKFAGSGGAIVGAYRDEAMFEELRKALGTIDSRLIKPQVQP